MSRVAGTVLVLLTAAICVRLGFWQLGRLVERRANNAVIESRKVLTPIDLNTWSGGELDVFRVARASGVFDFSRQIVRIGRPSGGVPGVVIVTPLLLRPNLAVLVERGWAPSADARTVDLTLLREPDSTQITGLLVEGGGSRFLASEWPLYLPSIHPDSLSARYPYELLPVLLRRTNPPQAGTAVFRAVDPPLQTEGPHLGYALQWFSFATIALVGGWILLYRQDPARPDGRALTPGDPKRSVPEDLRPPPRGT